MRCPCANVFSPLAKSNFRCWGGKNKKQKKDFLTSVCTIAGLCVLSIFTVWKMSTTPSYLIRSKTMLRVMKTPVRPTPALYNRKHRVHKDARKWCCMHKDILVVSQNIALADSALTGDILSILAAYLQWTEIGPSWPNCSFVLCTWPMKSMNPSPDFGTPCSGQSVNWNCLTVRDCPSCEKDVWKWGIYRATL